MDHDREAGGRRLRLTGARFEGGRLPIDSLIELQKYQEVVRIAARTAWRREHPNEELPADLNNSVSLAIEHIDEGSADVFMGFEQHTLYVQHQVEAQDAVDTIIGAAYADPSLPSSILELPSEGDFDLRQAISQLGITLSPGQSIEVYTASPDSPPIAITSETRERAIDNLLPIENFLLAPDEISSAEPLPVFDESLVGRVTLLDADDMKFVLVLGDETKVHGWYRRNPDLLEDFRALVNSTAEGPLTRISGQLQFKSGKPFRFKDANSIQRIEFEDTPWGARLAEFASLPSGWDNGEGAQISLVALDAAQMLLKAADIARIALPGVFADPEGGVLIEWANPGRVRGVEITAEGAFEMFSIRRDPRVSEHLETDDLMQAIAFIQAEGP